MAWAGITPAAIIAEPLKKLDSPCYLISKKACCIFGDVV